MSQKENTSIKIKSNSGSSNDRKVNISPDSVKAATKSSSIKEIKGSRPDVSRINNSQSTTVERPTGSKLPRGTGKPKGSLKPTKKQQPSY
ncbi:MAG TPA: hypothetical protein PKH02_02435 [Bacteroidales bacterium]|nr:hypothetical protein [Bacteroidales bacterium]